MKAKQEKIYLQRFELEQSIKFPHVYDELENSKPKITKALEKLVSKCVSEDEYQEWKKNLLETAKTKLHDNNVKVLACDYMFAGIGDYTAMIPEEGLAGFKCWIDGNGSAFFGEARPATEEEIEAFIAFNASEIMKDDFDGFAADVSEYNELLALETEQKDIGANIQPLCCNEINQVISCVDKMWKQMPDEEKKKYTKFRIVRTQQDFVVSSDDQVVISWTMDGCK